MNCEKCKNKKATLFYADEGGGRHALCTSCGAIQGKLSQFSSTEKQEEVVKQVFSPSHSLLSLLPNRIGMLPQRRTEDGVTCATCGMEYADMIKQGELGCAECYKSFGIAVDRTASTPHPEARMPSAYRRHVERQASIAEARAELKAAVACENYELAATLRDKIRQLEG